MVWSLKIFFWSAGYRGISKLMVDKAAIPSFNITKLIYTNIIIFFRSKDGQYELVWLEDGSVAFKANNGKFVGTKKSGHLYANCDTLDEPNAKYYFYLINRYFTICNLGCNDDFVFHNSKIIKSSDSHEMISPKVLKIRQNLNVTVLLLSQFYVLKF